MTKMVTMSAVTHPCGSDKMIQSDPEITPPMTGMKRNANTTTASKMAYGTPKQCKHDPCADPGDRSKDQEAPKIAADGLVDCGDQEVYIFSLSDRCLIA